MGSLLQARQKTSSRKTLIWTPGKIVLVLVNASLTPRV
jgi:hypothetical protein